MKLKGEENMVLNGIYKYELNIVLDDKMKFIYLMDKDKNVNTIRYYLFPFWFSLPEFFIKDIYPEVYKDKEVYKEFVYAIFQINNEYRLWHESYISDFKIMNEEIIKELRKVIKYGLINIIIHEDKNIWVSLSYGLKEYKDILKNKVKNINGNNEYNNEYDEIYIMSKYWNEELYGKETISKIIWFISYIIREGRFKV